MKGTSLFSLWNFVPNCGLEKYVCSTLIVAKCCQLGSTKVDAVCAKLATVVRQLITSICCGFCCTTGCATNGSNGVSAWVDSICDAGRLTDDLGQFITQSGHLYVLHDARVRQRVARVRLRQLMPLSEGRKTRARRVTNERVVWLGRLTSLYQWPRLPGGRYS